MAKDTTIAAKKEKYGGRGLGGRDGAGRRGEK
jgi:hypothetical protein